MPTFKLEDITTTSELEDTPALMRMAYQELFNRMFPVDPDEPEQELSKQQIDQVEADQFEQFRERLEDEPARLQGLLREAYIPSTHGQQAAYADKERQAEAFVNDPSPNALYYPSLYGPEAQARELGPAEMAQLISTRVQAWKAANAKIEGAAFVTKQSILQTKSTQELIDLLVDQWITSQ